MDVLLNSAEVNHVNAATGPIFSGQSAPVRSGSLATRSVGWRESQVKQWLDSRPELQEIVA